MEVSLKTILICGDVHVGCLDSVMPPEVVIEPWEHSKYKKTVHVRPVTSGHRSGHSKKDATTIYANSDQKWLFKCWKTTWRRKSPGPTCSY
jgi:hypothetical protein